jgi:hypothetical protein
MTQPTTQKEKMVITRLFNKIDLTAVRSKARTAKPVHLSVTKTKVKVSKNYKEEEITIGLDTFLKSQPGSVQDYLNECHDDIRTLIREQHAYSIKSSPGGLTILTRNKFRIQIKDIAPGKRSVDITGPKKEKWSYITELKSIKTEKVKV